MDHPPLESTAPSDWRYTAEGGANLVLSFVGQPGPFTGKLLRLRKKKLSHATGAIPEEVDVEFGRQIIQPLLGAQQVVAMERLAVTRDWLSTLKEALASSGNRPAHREEEDEVDEQTGVVVLAEDLVRGDGVLAIEIKVLQCTLLSSLTASADHRTLSSPCNSRNGVSFLRRPISRPPPAISRPTTVDFACTAI